VKGILMGMLGHRASNVCHFHYITSLDWIGNRTESF